ncbi:MAG: PD-(D/E)XK nuclease family protein [Planctomycetota bacterium]|jgi:hypothetical protein
MSEQLRISAKQLGAVALGSFCPRCFWLKQRLRHRLPFQIFPGIFSSIDAYTKRMVHDFFDRHRGPPAWLGALGPITGYRDPPTSATFNTVIDTYDIKLTGTPDAIFVRPDDSYVIADYKTARFTAAQDSLFPLYEAQLNAYAVLGLRCGFSPISGLGLIYFEPQTGGQDVSESNQRDAGFVMGFSARIKPVPVNLASLEPLLATARRLADEPEAPSGRGGCEDCPRLDQILSALGGP